jgi:DNA-binding transcriptional regulator YdaS (Cro superfamily)
MAKEVYVRVLRRAAELLGGSAALARRLGANRAGVEQWLRGEGDLPERVFLAAIDVIMEADAERMRRSAALRQASAEKIRLTLETLARTPGPLARRLGRAVDACLALTGARKGNVQLLDRGVLVLKAQRGFGEPFLRFFSGVRHETSSACSTALDAGRRVVIPDVASSEVLGEASREVLLAEGIAAVQSTPLTGSQGKVLGMLSTHYDHPGEPPEADLDAVGRVAARAQSWIEPRAR